ncbi:MAG: 16S rRNA (adenine(1518)-N(6)/adenine(1519)-N(6))-dimethyltransferase RsmA [Candidatus Bathyarchaeota archaeon]|nr:16S rRNA (adenine(1518)-N(6)/adenine(1519)-N(6))-dimethyltransferase RsmA [Candidatus Bathyarchaeota archaeon]
MSLYQKAEHLMRTYRVFPKKYLGQNFVVDEQFLQLMSSYASVGRSDVVLEVGAGFGFLTCLLAQKSRKVIAVEADARLMTALQNELGGFDNAELIEGNILKVAIPPFDKVVSNPPFSISSPLLFWLLKRTFNCAVLTFQKEFARRLDTPIGSKDYGRLTVSTSYHVEVELLDNVPKEAFYPPPDVDVVIVRLIPKRLAPFKVEDEEVFDEVVQTLFTQRNRKVRNAVLPLLRKYGLKGTAAVKRADVLPFHNKRVRDLAPEDFGALANELST